MRASPLLLALTLAGCATDRTTIDAADLELVPSMAPGWDEPDLTDVAALEGHSVRYRLTMMGVNCREYLIRADQSQSGWVRGVVKSRDKCGRTANDRLNVETQSFRASADDLAAFADATEAADIFRFEDGYWAETEGDTICIDGNLLIFERLDQQGYRRSTVNAQCSAPPAVIEITRMLIDISNAPEAERMLR